MTVFFNAWPAGAGVQGGRCFGCLPPRICHCCQCKPRCAHAKGRSFPPLLHSLCAAFQVQGAWRGFGAQRWLTRSGIRQHSRLCHPCLGGLVLTDQPGERTRQPSLMTLQGCCLFPSSEVPGGAQASAALGHRHASRPKSEVLHWSELCCTCARHPVPGPA